MNKSYKKHIKRLSFSILGVFILFSSCQEFDPVKVEPAFGLPILTTDLSLTDFLHEENDSNLYMYADEENLMHFRFSQFLDTFTMDYLVGDLLEDTIIDEYISLDFLNMFYNTSINLEAEANFLDSIDVTQIDSIKLDAGFFSAQLYVDRNSFDTLSIVVPSFRSKTGDSLKLCFNVNNYDVVQNIDLSNWDLNFTPAENTAGLIKLKLMCRVSRKGPVLVDTPFLKLNLHGLEIKSFYGKLGNYTELIDESESFPSFEIDEELNGSVNFDINQPDLSLVVRNGFNVPVQVEGLELKMINKSDTTDITGLPEDVFVGAGNANSYEETKALIASSTNIENAIAEFPEEFVLKGVIRTNPDDSDNVNSITDTDTIFVGVEGDIPLDITLSEVVMQDTVLADLSEELAFDLEALKFLVSVKNSFPIDLMVEIWALDNNNQFVSNILNTPFTISSNYPAEQSLEERYTNEFIGDELDNVLECKKMVFRISAQTKNSEYSEAVKFKSTQAIHISMVGFAKLLLE